MEKLSWRAVVPGAVLALALIVLTGKLFALAGTGLSIVYLFLAVFAGAYAAGWIAGREGVAQGLAVAVIYIAASATWGAYSDVQVANEQGPGALESLDLAAIVVGDLTALTAGVFGGWLAAGRRSKRA